MNTLKKIESHVVGIVAGLGMVVAAFLSNVDNAKTATLAIPGALLALGSVVAKTFKDKGVSVASIEASGSEVATALPKIKSDLASVTGLLDEYPQTKSVVEDVSGRLKAVEDRVTSIPGVDELVSATEKALLAKIAAPTGPPAS